MKTMVVDGSVVSDPDWTISKTDTRAMGTLLLGPSCGFIYHLSRHFGVLLDLRALFGVPQTGVAIEGNLGLQLAFGGKAGAASEADENDGEDEGSAVKEEPASAAVAPGSPAEEE
jgi:hypothetical protein